MVTQNHNAVYLILNSLFFSSSSASSSSLSNTTCRKIQIKFGN